jgi:hypothetical membrane protein|tara:strand:- start:5496 stop:5660 length:165 start_codon:yes stop_codon:yes gene_type:complete
MSEALVSKAVTRHQQGQLGKGAAFIAISSLRLSLAGVFHTALQLHESDYDKMSK